MPKERSLWHRAPGEVLFSFTPGFERRQHSENPHLMVGILVLDDPVLISSGPEKEPPEPTASSKVHQGQVSPLAEAACDGDGARTEVTDLEADRVQLPFW